MAYDKVTKLVTEFNKSREKFNEQMSTAFQDIFTEFFAQYPEIKAVAWTQYTPYFNDGEPCTFSRYEPVATVEELEEYSYSDCDGEFPYMGKPSQWAYDNRHEYASYDREIRLYEKLSVDPRYSAVCDGWEKLVILLESIPEEIYEEAFGDGVAVIATAKGITTDEYEHD